MRIPQRMWVAEGRFERAERRDQDAGGGFLADPAAAPALLQGPFLDRPFPAEHMPPARAGRRADAADRLDGAPYRAARRLDARSGRVPLLARSGFGDPQMRQIEGAQG